VVEEEELEEEELEEEELEEEVELEEEEVVEELEVFVPSVNSVKNLIIISEASGPVGSV